MHCCLQVFYYYYFYFSFSLFSLFCQQNFTLNQSISAFFFSLYFFFLFLRVRLPINLNGKLFNFIEVVGEVIITYFAFFFSSCLQFWHYRRKNVKICIYGISIHIYTHTHRTFNLILQSSTGFRFKEYEKKEKK